MKSTIVLSMITAIFVNTLNIPIVISPQEPLHFNQPVKYSTYDAVPIELFIEDQGSASTCWAISSNTLFELFVQKHYDHSVSLDFDHMIQNAPVKSTYMSGGSFEIAAAYYLNRLGPITESETTPYWLKTYSRYSNDFYAAKHFIKTNGAVITSIFFDAHRPGFYNEKTNAYYNPSTENPITHNVLLVGWDDTYSRDNFRNRPEKDGAFLAQNSFGSNWGDQGLFYISYEDVHVLNEFYALNELEKSTATSHQYYYNETGITHFDGFPMTNRVLAVNSFKNESPFLETIESIGIYTNQKNTSVKISIGKGEFDPNTYIFPLDALRYELYTPGYHRIRSPFDLSISPGESFYAVASIEGDSPFLVPIEAPYPNMDYSVFANPYEGYLGVGSTFTPNHLFRENASIGLRVYTRQLLDQN